MTKTLVGRTEDFARHPMIPAEAGGKKILVVQQGTTFSAIGDTCTHMGCSLATGTLEGGTVRCRCHGSVFDVSTGKVVHGPAQNPEPAYPVTVEDGNVFAEL
jgi:3-phenylpropionate/trans-cinnamate dioxygenase ferredoxin subunit